MLIRCYGARPRLSQWNQQNQRIRRPEHGVMYVRVQGWGMGSTIQGWIPGYRDWEDILRLTKYSWIGKFRPPPKRQITTGKEIDAHSDPESTRTLGDCRYPCKGWPGLTSAGKLQLRLRIATKGSEAVPLWLCRGASEEATDSGKPRGCPVARILWE